MKLFASDYDGTLHIDGEVSEETLNEIKRFRAAGNLFGIATGRSLNSISEQVKQYNIPVDFIIGNNGSVAVDGNRELLYHHFMNFDRVDEIIKRLPSEGVVFYGVSDGINVGLHDRLDQRKHVDSTFIEIGDVLDKEQAVGMFIRLDTDEQAEQFANELNEAYYGEIRAYNFTHYVDILNYGVTKSNGINQLIEIMDLDVDVFTIGDSFNDIPMIKAFDGFAICGGDPEVVNRASRCFENVESAIDYVMNLK
jgi:Cof subfamily protein (haloacid dehalogenase superfamily)